MQDETGRRWWQSRWWMAAAVLACAVPLLWPTIPPLLDLPGHMASYHVALNLDRSAALARFYGFQWQLLGNLGVDLLMVPLGAAFGVESGTKLAVIAIPVLTAAGFLLIAREGHRRLPATAAFALPLAYCYPLWFGFVNYCLGMALACLAFGLWLRLARQDRTAWRWGAFLLIAPVVYVTHAIGWALLCVMCGAAELHRQWRARGRPLPALVPTALACTALLGPIVLLLLGPAGEASETSGWLNPREIGKWALAVLRDRWLVVDLLSAAVVTGVVALAATRRFGLRFAPTLGWPALALLVTYVVAPKTLNGSDFVGARIIPYAAALLLLAIDTDRATRRQARIWALLATGFFGLRIVGNTASAALYDRAWTRNLAALDHVPEGATVATFSPWPCVQRLSAWTNPRIDHLSGMAVVRRDAFVNSEWTLSGLHLLHVRYDAAGNFRSNPSQIVITEPCPRGYFPPFAESLAALPRGAFDYVWLIGMPRADWPRAGWLTPVWSTDDAVLYRIVRSPANAG